MIYNKNRKPELPGKRGTVSFAVGALLALTVLALMFLVWFAPSSREILTPPAETRIQSSGAQASVLQRVDSGIADRFKILERQISDLTRVVQSGLDLQVRLQDQLQDKQSALNSAADAQCPTCPKCPAPQELRHDESAPRLRRNAVMGMSKGVDFPWLHRFVCSARTHMPSADVVLFTDAASIAGEDFKTLLRVYAVTAVLFDIEQDLKPAQRTYHPSSYRWLLMRNWLRGIGSIGTSRAGDKGVRYDAVMFVDARDTVFQADIFQHVKKDGLYIFQEQRPRTIEECGWNSGWVRDCFGDEGVAKVGMNVISCSGTTVGTWSDILVYADILADALETSTCERNGIDQGIHNYVVYSGDLNAKVSAMHMVSNEEGFIATVQSMPSVTRDLSGRVLNGAGLPVAAVHQYDRSQLLLRTYEAQFVWLRQEETRGK